MAVYISVLFFFFFSSRRRHTRYWRDWSSDVCSSDLQVPRAARLGEAVRRHRGEQLEELGPCLGGEAPEGQPLDLPRSEERRVGKECRTRGSRWRLKKQQT